MEIEVDPLQLVFNDGDNIEQLQEEATTLIDVKKIKVEKDEVYFGFL